MGEIGLHFHPHPLDWLHYETSFETVTGKKQDGDYLPLIQQTIGIIPSERSFQ
jgi:iron complex outermembrane receptor protein